MIRTCKIVDSTAQHSTAQHSTAQHSTALNSVWDNIDVYINTKWQEQI